MPSTLNPACLLCGLGYADRPLRELHVRGDPGHGDASDARTAQPCVSPHLTRATGFRQGTGQNVAYLAGPDSIERCTQHS